MLEAEAKDHPAYEHYLSYWDKRLEQQQNRAEANEQTTESLVDEQSSEVVQPNHSTSANEPDETATPDPSTPNLSDQSLPPEQSLLPEQS